MRIRCCTVIVLRDIWKCFRAKYSRVKSKQAEGLGFERFGTMPASGAMISAAGEEITHVSLAAPTDIHSQIQCICVTSSPGLPLLTHIQEKLINELRERLWETGKIRSAYLLRTEPTTALVISGMCYRLTTKLAQRGNGDQESTADQRSAHNRKFRKLWQFFYSHKSLGPLFAHRFIEQM